MLGDQGTDDRVTGSILPEWKVGVAPPAEVRERRTTFAAHAGRQADREIGIGITRTSRGDVGLPCGDPGRAGEQQGGAGA
jgi:hypothetical protein